MTTKQPNRFTSAITAENKRGFTAVIPDIKCMSPKHGDLLHGRDPAETAKALVKCGAPVLSVVTEPDHFGGSPKLLRDIAKATGVPILRKDFITCAKDIEETADLGASAVLLVCATTDEQTLIELYHEAISLGLEPLVETHTAAEMELARRLGARLVGINNRNIATLELDDGGPSRTKELSIHRPKDAVLVSESGILTPYDARTAADSGANAVLVGTALWQATDMFAFYKTLRIPNLQRKH